MHTFSETGAGVPAFLAKLWRLVEDPGTNHLIYWNKDGRSFIIQNQAQFARELLPLNYKHNNMASFIRQLNMYGFHKITSIDNGGLKFDRDEMEFSHPCFKRGHPYLLEHIKRKIATSKTTIDEKGLMKPEAVNKVLSEVKAMRGRQDSLDSRFSVMKQENEALWREIASLRQKHMKQQQIVNKLIQFLVTIVQPTRSNMTGVKRHFQLMINDAPQSSKMRKKSESDSGPIIHELTEELLDEVADSETDLLVSTSPNVSSPSNQMGSDIADEPSPESSSSSSNVNTFSNQSSDETLNQKNVIGSDNIVYNITEIPDNIELDDNFIEENILNTPMVKKEMLDKQMKKQKEKKRKISRSIGASTSGAYRGQQKNEIAGLSSKNIPLLKIKTEKDIDSLLFLDCSNDVSSEPSIDPTLISPLSGDVQNVTSGKTVGEGQQVEETAQDNKIFGAEGIMSTDMPSDLFEDSPMIGDINLASGSYNQNINLKPGGKIIVLDNSISPAENSISPGNSSGSVDNTGNSTNARSSTTPVATTSATETAITPSTVNNDDSQKSMTLAKYNSSKIADEDIMRLSTAEDVNSHLENVQEDLENLREILRGDGYSLDANTLLGLFSDSDVLAPYGLTISNENSQDADKKGSELISYQPSTYYGDFSDILYADSDPLMKSLEGNYDSKGSVKAPATPGSVLNTPYRE